MNENLNFVTAYLAEEGEGHHFPGLSVSLVRDQETLLSRGWGFANLDTQSPASEDTTYRNGSITKVFTAILDMQAVERGLFRLDDSVENTIPEVSSLNSPAPMALYHCITHSSGLPMMPPLPELKLGIFLAANTGQNPWAVAQLAHDVLEVLAD